MKSPWILADTNPYHVGWYEVKRTDPDFTFLAVNDEGVACRYWDGSDWFLDDGQDIRAAVAKRDAWRGVVDTQPMSFSEIAKHFGLNTTSVYQIYVRALPKLRAELDKRGIGFEMLETEHADDRVYE